MHIVFENKADFNFDFEILMPITKKKKLDSNATKIQKITINNKLNI